MTVVRGMRLIFIFIISVGLTACLQDAKVLVSGGNTVSVAAPTVNQSFFAATSPAVSTFVLNGNCGDGSHQVEFSLDSGVTWLTPTSGDFDCAGDNMYALSLPISLGLANWSPYLVSFNDQVNIQLRTSTNFVVASATTSITVQYINGDTPPVANNFSPASFNEDVQSNIMLSYTDANMDLAVACFISGTSNVTVTSACICVGGVCTVGVTGTSNFNGAASFNFEVMANAAISNTATASLTINPVDDAPVALNITPAAFNEDIQSNITLSYTDIDGDMATNCAIANLVNITQTGACSCAAGVCTVSVTGVANYFGAASFDYTVIANAVTSSSASATLTINSIDDAPVAVNITPASFNENTQSIITLSYSDAEAHLATVCALSALTNVTVTTPCTCVAGTCTAGVTGTAGYDGPASFGYTVTANGLVSNTATATLNILNVPVNSITLTNVLVPTTTSDSFEIRLVKSDDDNNTATITAYYCNATAVPTCDPQTSIPYAVILQGSVDLTTACGAGSMSCSAMTPALTYPNKPGDFFKVRIVATDGDGVTGSPFNMAANHQLYPVLDVVEQAQIEGNNFSFVVSLNQTYSQAVNFNYATNPVTAVSGTDYTPISGTATIPANQKYVVLPTLFTTNDATAESTETLQIVISAPSNAILRTAAGTGYITDNDPGLYRPAGFDNQVKAYATQSDGKRLVGGSFTTADDYVTAALALVGSNGIKNRAFNMGYGFRAWSVFVSMMQPNGKLLAAGNFTTYNGTAVSRFIRLNADGTLDNTFGNSIVDDIWAMALQSDGRIIVAGNSGYVNRFNSDGTEDTTFLGNTFTGSITSLAIQNDGQILVGGGDGVVPGRNGIARINSDGSTDPSFLGTGTGAVQIINSIQLQSDGKILIGGFFSNYSGTGGLGNLLRLNTNGTIDGSFAIGSGADALINSIAIQPDGKILIGGEFNSVNAVTRNRIARLNSNGSLDNIFHDTNFPNNIVKSVLVQQDGKIVLAGDFSVYGGSSHQYIVRVSGSTGVFDPTFTKRKGLYWTPAAPTMMSLSSTVDDQIIVSGDFLNYGGYGRTSLARINADGTMDPTFLEGLTGTNLAIFSIGVQSTGKIIIGGAFSSVNGSTRYRVAALNSDGTLDTGNFVYTTAPNPGIGVVNALVVHSDDKVTVGGDINDFNGNTTSDNIVKFNANGTLDGSFAPAALPSGTVSALGLQSTGDLIVGGSFTGYSGRSYLVRLNSVGTVDGAFASGSVPNAAVMAIEISPSNEIYIGGGFATFGGIGRSRIAKLGSNGNLDTTFVGTLANNTVYALRLQGDGKLLVGGAFTSFNAVGAFNRIARVNGTTGNNDAGFSPTVGTATGNVLAISVGLGSTYDIFFGGNWTQHAGQLVPYELLFRAP